MGTHSLAASPRPKSPVHKEEATTAPLSDSGQITGTAASPIGGNITKPIDDRPMEPPTPASVQDGRQESPKHPRHEDGPHLPPIAQQEPVHIIPARPESPPPQPSPSVPSPPTQQQSTPMVEDAPAPPVEAPMPEAHKDAQGDTKMRDRSPSPPRQPRFRPSVPQRGSASYPHPRRTSRSPPRGPRNHPKPSAGPTGPTQSGYPNAPRGPRRTYPQQAISPSPSVQPAPGPPPPTTSHALPPESESRAQVLLPPLDTVPPTQSLTHELDAEVSMVPRCLENPGS